MGMRVAALGFPLGMGILRDVKGPAGQKRPVQFPWAEAKGYTPWWDTTHTSSDDRAWAMLEVVWLANVGIYVIWKQ